MYHLRDLMRKYCEMVRTTNIVLFALLTLGRGHDASSDEMQLNVQEFSGVENSQGLPQAFL